MIVCYVQNQRNLPNISFFLFFSGEDISVCVCLAILMSLFDEKGKHLYITHVVTND